MPIAAFVLNLALVRDARRLIRTCTAAARASGWEAVFIPTARDAVAAGAELVFAGGGDGTVQRCARDLAGTSIPMAIIPLGTANLTARALGVPHRTGPALEAGFGGADRRIDLAVADDGETVITAMTGIGLDAAVVAATRHPHKHRLGWVAYAASGVAHLSAPAAAFQVTLDDGEPLTRTARCVVVGNAGLLPGGFTLLPGARLDDGLLDVGILSPEGTWGWALLAGQLLAGQLLAGQLLAGQVLARSRPRPRGLERYQARRVEITSDVDLPREADGELLAPGRRLAVSAWPAALTVRLRV